jgi:arylsulfatase
VHRAAAGDVVGAGAHTIGFEYRRARGGPGGGPVSVLVDGAVVASVDLPIDLPFRWQVASAGLFVGRDRGLPVCDDYEPPFPFTGTIGEVVIEVPALTRRDVGDDVRSALRHE